MGGGGNRYCGIYIFQKSYCVLQNLEWIHYIKKIYIYINLFCVLFNVKYNRKYNFIDYELIYYKCWRFLLLLKMYDREWKISKVEISWDGPPYLVPSSIIFGDDSKSISFLFKSLLQIGFSLLCLALVPFRQEVVLPLLSLSRSPAEIVVSSVKSIT